MKKNDYQHRALRALSCEALSTTEEVRLWRRVNAKLMRARAPATWALLALFTVPARAETVSVNGIELHYTVKGSGEPLLLLHGFGSCATRWKGMADKLAANHKVISVDARGHGWSTNAGGKFSHAQAAEDIRALLDALKITKARAIGFSSGGMTLLHVATRHPDRLSKMVVVGAGTHFPDEARAIMQSASIDTLPSGVLRAFRQCATRGEEQVRWIVGQYRALGFSKNDMNFQPSDLAKIRAATLVVHGDRDRFFPVAIPVTMYRSISGAALWIVPKGDHAPTAGAEEAAFLSEVESFLAH